MYIDKKTIIFDLDETLIHCNGSTDSNSDTTITIKIPGGEHLQVIETMY